MFALRARMVAGTESAAACTLPVSSATTVSGWPPVCTMVISRSGLRPCFSSAKRDAKSDNVPNRVAPKSLPFKSWMRVMSGRLKIEKRNFFSTVATITVSAPARLACMDAVPPSWMIGTSPESIA